MSLSPEQRPDQRPVHHLRLPVARVSAEDVFRPGSCHAVDASSCMDTCSPLWLSLFMLQNPTECPYNGSRREDCPCRKDYTAAGLSTFSKVRLDVTTLQIITTDLQFANTTEGRPVPFATAGDCYIAAKCPQGRFSINLK
ncbi:A disintegrin and metalloproteinase with thrombospondin motifs 9-like [Hyperolius riggenbachi]|uniref:A disintegrin and metalloproteinase with thrombospondin motifs 9-like n=1 Tax=Hyperolius riggenbachi TaxID=752182 RepID=UPI0035A2F5C5